MMKLYLCFAALAFIGSVVAETPMQRTVALIEGLRKEVASDGKKEQASFDTYACWCEKTMERKAADISAEKELITETQILIKKLKGEIASHGAEIEQLKKDIAQANAAVKEATDVRTKENKQYQAERSESEQCIGALEAATKVLTGAGAKKAGFLETFHEAELMSVAAGLQTALKHKVSSQSVSQNDMEVMKHFVSKPGDFVGPRSSGMSAAQVGQNPFGDYAPQSTQIQGILKGMYDAFTADLEKDNAEEAESQKSFEELMGTKRQELATLEDTLEKQETDMAAKTKKLSESEVLLDDTVEQLKADETFFEDTKEACQVKATEWSVRTRLRTEELNGMDTAIRILSSKEAKKTFKDSTETFLQLAAVQHHAQSESASSRAKAYTQLTKLARAFKSRDMAKIAVEIKSGGHFDKVIVMIDEMIGLLRKEEQEDIEHRDRCENSQNANKNELDDLKNNIDKTKKSLKRMGNTKKELEDEIGQLKKDIKATKKDMKELLDMRNDEVADFRQALKDDSDAIGLLKQAIVALSKYYKNNKIAMPELLQRKPEYTQDDDKPPETTFSSSDSRKSETGGILAILEMLVEDLEKEMAEGRADDADAQDKYLEQTGALQESLDAQEQAKANTETELGDLEEKMSSYEKHLDEKKADKSAEDDTEKSLNTDCEWVKTHFKSRREKRKTEIQGLVDAKAFLAGVAAGNDPLPLE
jgi:peptidoglycan hydrolase CwlO-like protein